MAKITVKELQEYAVSMAYKTFQSGDVIVCTKTPIGQRLPVPGDVSVVVSQHAPLMPASDGSVLAATEVADLIVMGSEDDREGKRCMSMRHAHSGFYELAAPEQIEAWENRPEEEVKEKSSRHSIADIVGALN